MIGVVYGSLLLLPRFLHGPHAGQRIEWLAEQLVSGSIALDDPSMVLNVVYFHGHYRSLNNRHLTAIIKYAGAMEKQGRLPRPCCVRVWPLVRYLSLRCGWCVGRVH